jgi:hypothetical protein
MFDQFRSADSITRQYPGTFGQALLLGISLFVAVVETLHQESNSVSQHELYVLNALPGLMELPEKDVSRFTSRSVVVIPAYHMADFFCAYMKLNSAAQVMSCLRELFSCDSINPLTFEYLNEGLSVFKLLRRAAPFPLADRFQRVMWSAMRTHDA